MTIKLDNENPNRVVVSGQNCNVKATQGESVRQTQRSRNANSEDKVTITRVSIDLQNALDSLSDVPIVDAKRVEEIKSAIQQNTYQIDSSKVAQKMMQLERTLLGRDRRG
jgi:negative regulator of flagellin synthesis FlgM